MHVLWNFYNGYILALTIFVRSPADYEAVKGLNILNLPRRSLECFSGLESHPPGVSHHYLCEQWKNYQAHCEKLQGGHPKPVSEGVLIFDEVKVQKGVPPLTHTLFLTLCFTYFSLRLQLFMCIHVHCPLLGLLAHQNQQDCRVVYDT